MTQEGDVSGQTAPGLALAPGQQRRLGQAIKFSNGRQSTGRGRGHRIVRLPRKLATSEAFTFGYSRGRGLVPAERPSGGGRLLAVRDELVDIDGDSYGWVGHVYVADDPEMPVGTISLVYRQGGDVQGTIQVRTDLYRIEPLGNRLHVLVDVDEDTLPDGGGDPQEDGGAVAAVAIDLEEADAPMPSPSTLDLYESEGPESGRGVEVGSGAPMAAQGADVASEGGRYSFTHRVLVLYTDAAAFETSYIEGIVNEAIINSNQAYRNSVTSPTLRLVHQQILIGFNETGNIINDLADLQNNFTARSLRDSYKADLVVLLTKPDAYPSRSGGTTTGRANVIYTPGKTTSEGAYAIADVKYAVSNKTFTHEVGHLQGGRHHPDDDRDACGGTGCPDDGYEYGRGERRIWSDCFYGAGWLCGYNRFATIMAYAPGAYTRVQHLSNPDVEYQGKATGTDTRDNARALENSVTTIAAYRSDPLTAFINGPSVLSPGETATWYADATGGTPGVPTYRWYRDGVFTGVTTQAYTADAGYNDFSLRVDVTRGGDLAVRSKYVTVFDNGGCAPDVVLCPGPDPGGGFLTVAPEAFALGSVGPNPVSGEGVVTFDVPEASAVAVVLYDVLGREVARPVDREVGAGTHRARLDASALSPGLYVLVMRAGDFISSRQITVAR